MRRPPHSIQEIIAEAEGCIWVEEAGLGRSKLRSMEGREERREDPRISLGKSDLIMPLGTTKMDDGFDPEDQGCGGGAREAQQVPRGVEEPKAQCTFEHYP